MLDRTNFDTKHTMDSNIIMLTIDLFLCLCPKLVVVVLDWQQLLLFRIYCSYVGIQKHARRRQGAPYTNKILKYSQSYYYCKKNFRGTINKIKKSVIIKKILKKNKQTKKNKNELQSSQFCITFSGRHCHQAKVVEERK